MFDDYFDWEGRSDDKMWVGIQRAGVDDPWVWIESGVALDNYFAWYNQPNAEDGVTIYSRNITSNASWNNFFYISELCCRTRLCRQHLSGGFHEMRIN